ncbi:MAG: hypothetical protein EOM55_02880 [Clostridia bacterium]|nr:hypothetical protein [Clostridia bacterium]
MPRRDGTGPAGKGPRTGRRFGDCDDDLVNFSQADKNSSNKESLFEQKKTLERNLQSINDKLKKI